MGGFQKFTKNSLIYSGGNLLQKSSQLLLIPVLTRYLGPSEYGEYAALVAILGVVTILTDLGISTSLSRFVHDYWDRSDRLATYLRTSFVLRIGTAVIGSAFYGIILFLVWPFLLPESQHAGKISPLVAMVAAGTVLVDFACSYYQARTEALLFVFGKLGQTLLQCAFSIIAVVVFGSGVIGVFAGQAIGSVVVGIFIARHFWAQCGLGRGVEVNWLDLKHNVLFGLPLVPHRVGAWFRSASDRVILGMFLPLPMVGVYQLGYSVGNMLGMVVTCSDLAFAPFYYRIRKIFGGSHSAVVLRNYSICYIFSFGLLVIATIIFVPQIISLLAPASFSDAVWVTPLIAFSIFLQAQYTLAVKPLFYLKKTVLVALSSLVPAAVGTFLNYMLVSKYGVLLAVWTTVGMYGSGLVVVLLLVGKDERIGFPIGFALLCNIGVFGVALVATYSKDIWADGRWFFLKVTLLLIFALGGWFSLVRRSAKAVIKEMTLID